MSGNSRQRRRERRAVKGLLRFMPKRYRWDVGVLLFGAGLTLMATEAFAALFWPGVVCVYLGIWLLGRHLFDDDNILPRVPAIRKALVVVLGVVVGYYWSVNVAMTKAPMNISAYSTIGDYPPETNINGIPWNRDLYSDLRVDIDNPTDSDYRELD
jgi:hypothetical protein